MSNIIKCENCGCEEIDIIHKYKGIYMRVDFDDLEIRQYKEKLKAGEIDE